MIYKFKPFSFSLELLCAIFTLLIGIFFRLYKLDAQSMWADELFSVAVSTIVGNDDFEIKHPHLLEVSDGFWTWKLADQSPPLYEIILKAWLSIFEASDTTARLPSAIFGAFLLLYSFISLKDVLPNKIVLYYIAFLSLSFGLIQYSQEARPYALACLLSGMLTVELSRNLIRDIVILPYYVIVLMILLGYTHYFGLLVVVSHALIYTCIFIKQRSFAGITRLTLVGLFILPYLLLAKSSILFTKGMKTSASTFDELIFGNIHTIFKFAFPSSEGVVLMLMVACLIFVNLMSAPVNQHYKNIGIVNAISVFIFVTLATIILNKAYFIHERQFIFILPSVYLSLAILLGCVSWKAFPKICIILMVGHFFVTMDKVKTRKTQYREASRYISRNYRSNDVIVTSWRANRIHYLYYLQKFIDRNIENRLYSVNSAIDLYTFCSNSLLAKSTKVFVFFPQAHAAIFENMKTNCKNLELVSEKRFIGVGVNVFYTK
ncbi:MAG: glycosyltransferase family 39 protein [Methylococcales bacterium]